MGVCKGIAEWKSLPVFWIRILVILATLTTGILPGLIVYIFIGLCIGRNPLVSSLCENQPTIYNRSIANLSTIKESFNRLENKVRKLENLVTSKEYEWQRKFNS
ncbi:MAG TPA: PspC domain-containing protein [Verrucomicrobia bacterium]|nr:PspC domain-containing protein [Verrucomicrobiota bacterium]